MGKADKRAFAPPLPARSRGSRGLYHLLFWINEEEKNKIERERKQKNSKERRRMARRRKEPYAGGHAVKVGGPLEKACVHAEMGRRWSLK